MADLVNTGERLHTEVVDVNAIEHLHRYAFACSLVSNLDVLDIASGEGYGSNLLAGHAKSVIGVDISPDAVTHASGKYKKSNLRYLQGSTDSIPVSSGSLDCVVSFETLEHHDRHDEMLAEIKRILKPNGLLILSTPDKLNYSDKPKQKNEFHVKELYFSEFQDLISRHFKSFDIYGQRAGFYGLLVPNSSQDMPFNYFSGNFTVVEVAGKIPEPIYSVAIASDGALPSKHCSAFAGESVYEGLRRLSHNQASELERMERRLEASRRELTDLKRSLSYSIGRTLTWPLRIFRPSK